MSEQKEGGLLIKGQSGSTGIAIGEVHVLDSKAKTVAPRQIKKGSVQSHQDRFKKAKTDLIEELRQMGSDLKDRDSSDIIATQQQIIEDPEVERKVFAIISDNLLSVDFAVYQTFCEFIERLKESGSELFQQRIVDLEDMRDRMVNLVCENNSRKRVKKGSVIVTHELSPTELISYYENGVAGLVMEKGGVTSHAAIIAQSLGIPCVVSSKNAVKSATDASLVVIDGDSGEVHFDPDQDTLKAFKARKKQQRHKKKNISDQEIFETKDGMAFRLMANVEFQAEIKNAVDYAPQGVGLLRTESLLFGRRFQKSFDEQVSFYTAILEGIQGPATIRLFDVGGDKGTIRSSTEANPFLGWRGVRMLLDEREILRNQLRAILTVAAHHPGRVRILVPMVSVVSEVHEIRKELERVQAELLSSGITIDEHVPLGLMVEVPSVALSAYDFARQVDFLSVGTNDLTQYSLAVDRGNENICQLFQHYNPAVLKLIKMTVQAARKADVEVSVCGELAGDEIGAACLFGMGIRELSMVPQSIPKIKKLLTSYHSGDFKDFAQQALEKASAREVQELFEDWTNR